MKADPSDEMSERTPGLRVMAYCHDGVGIGHLRRTLNICTFINRSHPNASFLVTTGSPYTSLFTRSLAARNSSGATESRIDVLKLPSVTKVSHDEYRAKYVTLSSKTIWRFRESLLISAAKHFEPDVLLVDKAPAGVHGELVETIRWLREHRPETRIVFGMRDIEDESSVTIHQWSKLGIPAILESCYDEIWVYGMQDVFDVTAEYALSPQTATKIKYMGYVAQEFCDHDVQASDGMPQVLVTVGGGTDGTTVLDNYLAEAARAMAAEGVRSFVVAGPDLPADNGTRLRKIAQRIPNTEWIDFAPCMMCLIRQADLVVTMGGYNTLCEIARHRTPALVVPRTSPRLEQLIRAQLWETRGIVEVVDPGKLAPETLSKRVTEMRSRGITATAPNLDLGGLTRVLDRFQEFCDTKSSYAPSLCM